MNCDQCQHPIAEGNAFCGRCGAKQSPDCSACGARCAPNDTFCGSCGERLGESAASERRPLTVMFCDLVDSTEMSTRFDAEELLEVLRTYQEMATNVVRSFEGHVAQYLGDGLLVYFGYPFAHEDDPARAVHTALRIQRQLPEVNARLAEHIPGFVGHEIDVRIGIHSGPVVVGSIGIGARAEQLATGETVNVAARLEALAPAGQVVVSQLTERLVRADFTLSPLGPQQLKGIAEPISVFRVEGEIDEGSRPLALPGATLTPLVARATTIHRLETLWTSAREGHGCAVELRGEAGIGKSRLVRVLQQHTEHAPRTLLGVQASALHQRSAFHPVLEALRRTLEFKDADSDEQRLQKLADAVAAASYDRSSAVFLMAELLSLDTGDLVPPQLSQAERRAETLQVLVELALASSRANPLMLIIEDLHWLDPSTLEWLGRLLQEIDGAPILVVMTTRPTFDNPWENVALMRIALEPLAGTDIEQLVRNAAGAIELPDHLLAQLVERSGGIPLFAEELVRTVLESVSDIDSLQHIETLEIPDTLLASLTARLDRVGPARELAQVASVIGQEFSQELIQAIAPIGGFELVHALDTLVASGILRRSEDATGVRYSFDHALLQDTAYQSMLRSRRRSDHERVAKTLCGQFPETVEKQPEIVAHHYDKAGCIAEAIDYYERAGTRATFRHANEEAAAHFERGLELLESTPATPERNHLEIGMQLGLGVSQSILRAYSDPAVGHAYRRALDLCRASVASEPRFFEVLYGLSRHHQVLGELDEAVALGEELLAHSEQTGAVDQRLSAHSALAQNLYWQGNFQPSLEHARAAIEVYEPDEGHVLREILGTDPGVVARVFASFSLWALGKPVEAIAIAREGIGLAQDLGHLHSEAFITGFTSILSIMLRDPKLAMEMGTRAMQLSDDPRLPIFWGQGRVVRGWARVSGEGDANGIDDIKEGIALLASLRTGSGAPGFMSVLAETNARLGDHEGAVGVSGLGLATSAEKGQLFFVADLLTVRGLSQLAIATDCDDADSRAQGIAEAEATLRKAVETAEQQGARSLMLRASIALARCQTVDNQDRIADARARLAAAYAGFEDCVGQEHDEARALLKELS